ncbi:MAG: SocA family protein [Prevotella sp.]|nr:SocA family protein [Prevotella sp.]
MMYMENIYLQYQRQKTKEVMLYILSKMGDTGYFRLMKTMFCADRQSLLRWGGPITNLNYYARKHGPVPSVVHDGLLSAYQGQGGDYSDILTVKGNFMMVHPLREPDLEYLSESDKESIDKAINELKGRNRDQIENYLHEKVYHRVLSTDKKQYSRVDIAMSAGASDKQIARIENEEQILKALS